MDGSGNVIVTGSSTSTTGSYDYYTAKYAAADGALLWEQRYNGPGNGYDVPAAVAVDADGNVVVTGYSFKGQPSYDMDFYTAKYAAANGAILWGRRYDGPSNFDDFAKALAVDGSGNVVVTGLSYAGNSQFGLEFADCYTAKYAAASGALLWERSYNGPGGFGDAAYAVALDGSGNVAVAGVSYNRNPSFFGDTSGADYYVAKYGAANGVPLWEKRYDGPTDGGDSARSVAVDAAGNVVVTGSSSNGDDDYFTAKLASGDGALLWEQRLDGPGENGDIAYAVKLDGSGNAIVAGYSAYRDPPNYWVGCYTVKYSAANGAIIWESGFEQMGFPAEQQCLALGRNGRIAITGAVDVGFATVNYRETLAPLSVEPLPGGHRIRFKGFPGLTYNIERASHVTGPWSTNATPTAPFSGEIEYVDASSPVDRAFYRISAP